MKKPVIYSSFITLLLIGLWQCQSNCPETPTKETAYTDASNPGQIIADTITYDVIIKNFDTSQVWQKDFLKHLDHSLLIDTIFSGVYSGKFTPYDFFTEEKISLRDLRIIENEPWFNRNDIGKIQFCEVWYFNESCTTIKKKVVSIVLGIEQFDNNGNLRGHKPVFKIYLNQPEAID